MRRELFLTPSDSRLLDCAIRQSPTETRSRFQLPLRSAEHKNGPTLRAATAIVDFAHGSYSQSESTFDFRRFPPSPYDTCYI